MAKHEVIIRENTGVTKEEAPYLPQYVKKVDLDFTSLCDLIADEAGLTATQTRAIIEGAFEEFIKMEKEAPVRIHIDGLTLFLTLLGSFPASDSAFDPEVNSLQIAISLDDDVRNTLADVTPRIVTDETATIVRITEAYDRETPIPYGVFYGLRAFDVQGVNLVMGDAGAGVVLVNAAGATFECDVDTAHSTKQVVKCCPKQLLEAGDYKLFVKSRGGDAEASLQTPFRRVKYVKATPTVSGVEKTSWTVEDGGELNAIIGTNLPNAGYRVLNPVNKIVVKFTKPGATTETTVEVGVTEATSTKVSFQPANIWDALSDVATGATMTATYQLKNGNTAIGAAQAGTIIKGEE